MMIHSDAMAHMDEQEFVGNLILLIVGGNDTTRNTMSALAYGLDLFPDERAKLEARPVADPQRGAGGACAGRPRSRTCAAPRPATPS